MDRALDVIVWGTGIDYDGCLNMLRYFEGMGQIRIVGITGNDVMRFGFVDGYPCIPVEKVASAVFDLIVIASEKKWAPIMEYAVTLGISKEKIVLSKVFSLPDFKLDSYLQLKKDEISIFANCCWGGYVYHRLGLERFSPFFNMLIEPEEYLKILSSLERYVHAPLVFEGTSVHPRLGQEYPIMKLLDAKIHFNHCHSVEEATVQWESRVGRIHWDNLFIMMYATEQAHAEEFLRLPYEHKFCFVPFETDIPNLITVPYSEEENNPFYVAVNQTATGKIKNYDLLELLCDNFVSRVQ